MDKTQAALALAETVDALVNPDLSKALKLAQDDLGEQAEESFREKVDPDKEPWEPAKYEYGWPLEVRTGFMYLTVGDQVNEAVIGNNLMELPDDDAALAEYAGYQDEGVPGNNLPARPFLGFGQETLDKA